MNALLKKILVVSIVLPLTFSTAFAGQGGKGGNRDAMPFKSMLSQLDLTQEQKNNIKTIMTEYRSSSPKGALHDAQMSLLKAPKFDEKQAQSLIDAREATKKAQKVKKMNLMYDVYHSLTPEQQADLDKMLAEKKANKGKKGNKGKNCKKGEECKKGKGGNKQGQGKNKMNNDQ